MRINKNTRISEIIRFQKESIDAIASLSTPLKKLKNPLLRKLMAPRVTLEEAASIGGCSLQEFIEALRPFGFEFQDTNDEQVVQEKNRPTWLKDLPADHLVEFDVRQMLEDGQDPLKEIMRHVKQLSDQSVLCIISSFLPTPLVKLLGNKGMSHYSEEKPAGVFRVYFIKSRAVSEKKPFSGNGPRYEDSASFRELLRQFDPANVKEIDVRNLEMPEPMHTILREMRNLQSDGMLYVNHKRVPVYLLEQISEQPYNIHILEKSDGEVRLVIYPIK